MPCTIPARPPAPVLPTPRALHPTPASQARGTRSPPSSGSRILTPGHTKHRRINTDSSTRKKGTGTPRERDTNRPRQWAGASGRLRTVLANARRPTADSSNTLVHCAQAATQCRCQGTSAAVRALSRVDSECRRRIELTLPSASRRPHTKRQAPLPRTTRSGKLHPCSRMGS